jgi:DNA-binding NarL/FixJ family response regulator
MSKFFNPREYECWITGPKPERIDAHYPDAPKKQTRRDLTKAETYCLKMHRKGWTPLRIANSMNIAEVTVRKYITKAQAKQRS